MAKKIYPISENSKRTILEVNKRRLGCTPSEKNHRIFLGYCYQMKRKKTSAMNEVFLAFINTLTDRDKQKYLALHDSLTIEQINSIGKKSEDDGC